MSKCPSPWYKAGWTLSAGRKLPALPASYPAWLSALEMQAEQILTGSRAGIYEKVGAEK